MKKEIQRNRRVPFKQAEVFAGVGRGLVQFVQGCG